MESNRSTLDCFKSLRTFLLKRENCVQSTTLKDKELFSLNGEGEKKRPIGSVRMLSARQSNREEKMRDWFVKLVARDRNRAADKRALKELIENKAAKNSPLHKPGMACTSSTLSQPVTSSVSRDLSCSQQSTDSPVPTTRSNMEVYKFVSFLRRQISRVSSGNYITHMGESNYAKSTQKASNVYGQKSSHKRRQERYYMHE